MRACTGVDIVLRVTPAATTPLGSRITPRTMTVIAHASEEPPLPLQRWLEQSLRSALVPTSAGPRAVASLSADRFAEQADLGMAVTSGDDPRLDPMGAPRQRTPGHGLGRQSARPTPSDTLGAWMSAAVEAACTSPLAQIVELADVGLAVVSGDRNVFELANPAFRRLVGGRDVVGSRVRDVLPGVLGVWMAAAVDTVRASGEPRHFPEQPLPSVEPDREPSIVCSFDFRPLPGDGRSSAAVLVVASDVTAVVRERDEMRRRHRAAEEARAAAEDANLSKMQFLATMSHELRTPLSTIAGYVELLELGVHGPMSDVQMDDIRRIRRSESYLRGILNAVLDYVRIEAGTTSYAIDPVLIGALMDDMEALITPQMRAKGLAYAWLGCESRLRVSADGAKLRQVVLNLITNAVKFTPAGGAVRVSCESSAEHVTVSVADTGPGIPTGMRERIFQPFVQLDTGLTKQAQGVGLGLAISREFARAMGGDLTVADGPDGRGSTFTLTLPRA